MYYPAMGSGELAYNQFILSDPASPFGDRQAGKREFMLEGFMRLTGLQLPR